MHTLQAGEPPRVELTIHLDQVPPIFRWPLADGTTRHVPVLSLPPLVLPPWFPEEHRSAAEQWAREHGWAGVVYA